MILSLGASSVRPYMTGNARFVNIDEEADIGKQSGVAGSKV